MQSVDSKYEMLMDMIPDPAAIVQNERLQMANPPFSGLFGYTVGDIGRGVQIDKLVRETAQLAYDSDNSKTAKRIDIISKDGSVVPCEISIAEIEYRDRAAKLCLIRDVTDYRNAEDTLLATHEQLQATLNALPDLLFEVGFDGRIFDIRAPQPELLYLPPEQFLGKTVSDVLPKEASEIIQQSIKTTRETGKFLGAVYSLEIQGEPRWFELSAAIKGNPSSEDCRIVALARDITERKRSR